jgi:4-hydroxybenzoate polyprenyltransferase
MNILTFIRWKEWAPDKITYFFTFFFYIALRERIPPHLFLPDFLIGIAFISSLAVFGYLSNDLGDREMDIFQGKRNSLSGLAPPAVALVFAVVVILMFIFGLWFIQRRWFVLLWGAQVVFAVSYSLLPLRLKSRGWPGLAANVIAQYTIPVALIFSIFGDYGSVEMLVMILCATAAGADKEFSHQRHHLAFDMASGTRTWAVRMGPEKAFRFYRYFLLADLLSIAALIVCLLIGIPTIEFFGLMGLPPALPVLMAYILLLVNVFVRRHRLNGSGHLDDPHNYRGPRKRVNILFTIFPNIVIPIYLAGLLACYNYYYLFLVLFCLLWISPVISKKKVRDILGAE